MIVIFKPENCYPPRRAGIQLDQIVLTPGVNHLSPEQTARLRAHPTFGQYQARNAIVVQEPVSEVTPIPLSDVPSNLSGYNVEQAEEIIDQTHDVDVLQRWLSGETRKTARTVIERRIDNLKGGK
jgi:hypothetical protein